MDRAWINVRVAKKWTEAIDIVSLELVSTNGESLPTFSAGAHIDVELPNKLVRQYSLCNDAKETHRYQIGVLLDPETRGGSKSIHLDLIEGSEIRISEPRNHFSIAPAGRSLLFAGGIGVTPILCMAEHLAATGAAFEMHYCTRSKERAAFYNRLMKSSFADCVHFHFDTDPAEQRLHAMQVLARPELQSHLYVCGPKGFMDHILTTARELDWAEANIHFEYFAGQTTKASGDQAFEIRLASSGRTILVTADQSMLAALNLHGVEVPVSCEQGVCGTCVTRVLEGEPDHRDMYFTDAEKAKNDQLTVCCSRAKSPILVLDL